MDKVTNETSSSLVEIQVLCGNKAMIFEIWIYGCMEAHSQCFKSGFLNNSEINVVQEK